MSIKAGKTTKIAATKADAEAIRQESEAAAKAGEGFTPAPNSTRAEEVARQREEMEAAAAKLEDQVGLKKINPTELIENNREALHQMEGEGLEVSNQNPAYYYGWFDPEDWRDRFRIGYRFVTGAMREGREHADGFEPGVHRLEDFDGDEGDELAKGLGQRRIGNLTLMRIRKDVRHKFLVHEALERARQQHDLQPEDVRDAAAARSNTLPLVSAERLAIRERLGLAALPDIDRRLRMGNLGHEGILGR